MYNSFLLIYIYINEKVAQATDVSQKNKFFRRKYIWALSNVNC